MAGIGFELKKIFKERSVANLIKGVFYSSFTIIGPMLITILCLMLLYAIMGYQNVGYESRDLLVAIILYTFIFSMILTSPLSAVISRYIADKIFEEEFNSIMPCYNAGLLINTVIGLIFCVPFIIIAVYRGNVDPLLMFMAGCLFMALLFVYYNMTFISALKEYKSITMAFVAGMGFTAILSFVLYYVFELPFVFSIVIGMAAGFMMISFILSALVKRFFKVNNNQYREFLSYLWRYKVLLFTNLCYSLGLYIHNFIFWMKSPLSNVVADTFYSAQSYDTATFLAMITNISATVIFTVRVEIKFHERYQVYCQQLLGGTGGDITIAKNNMFQTLVKELFYIVQIQTSISIVVFMMLMIFSGYLGFGGMIMTIYPLLAAGYFVIFIMYCMIVFLYYYDDGIGAFISSLVFFIVTLIATIFALHLSPAFYGIGPFAGAFCGWTFSFFRLKYIERTIDQQMFCKGELVKRVYTTLDKKM